MYILRENRRDEALIPDFSARFEHVTRRFTLINENVVADQSREIVETNIKKIIDRQRESCSIEGFSASKRMDRIDRAIALLVENSQGIVDALMSDFGNRSQEGSLATDVFGTLSALKYAKKNVKKWMRPSRRQSVFPLGLLGASTRIEYQPLGSVGTVVPWNFPFNLCFGPLGSIFAAGNRVIIKPSEFTPTSSDLIKELVGKYFDEDESYVVLGGPAIGELFCSQPFDHLLFTGSTSIASSVMKAAAKNLVPVTLELGGKSPVIVSESADLGKAATRIMAGKTLNAGQICLAPDYVLVDSKIEDRFISELRATVREMYPTMIDNPDYTAVINHRHRERLRYYLDDAAAKGAELVELKPEGEQFQDERQIKIPPTLVLSPAEDMSIMTEEIFGPILPIRTYGTIDDAICYINERPHPLGLYYFGSNHKEELRVIRETTSGGITINDVITHIMQDDAPFGGVGPSGTGAYHGREGFLNFSHSKTVFRQTSIDFLLKTLRPPYGEGIRRFLNLMIKK